MDTSIVFRKTSDGETEVASPRLELDTLGRQLLVLIDGRRSVADLSLLLSGQGDVTGALFELLRQSLITTSSSGGSPPTGPVAVQAPPSTAPAPPAPTPAAPASMPETWPGAVVPQSAPAPGMPPQPQPPQAQTLAPQQQPPQPLPPQPPAPAAPSPAPPSPAPASPAPAAESAQSLEDVKMAILREVRELFGRDGDPVAAKLRACHSFADLRLLVSRIRQIAVDYAGRDAADEFTATAFRQIELGEQP